VFDGGVWEGCEGGDSCLKSGRRRASEVAEEGNRPDFDSTLILVAVVWKSPSFLFSFLTLPDLVSVIISGQALIGWISLVLPNLFRGTRYGNTVFPGRNSFLPNQEQRLFPQ